jgi:FtsP/CotA-like multicopper oxidase with cupredoxin domain
MDVADGAAEYAIHLVNHPPGLYWFHPHMHGIALNQVTSGLAGVITVGAFIDECRGDVQCRTAISAGTEHLLVLKDTQVRADGTLLNQQEPTFCHPTALDGEMPRHGVCPGNPTTEYAGGHWFHTINGQVYPSISIGEHGEEWRIVNAAGSRSYDLSLQPEDGSEAIPLQVLSIDGITIAAAPANLAVLQAQLGLKMAIFPCPDLPGAGGGNAVCTRHVRMMPSSRVALRVLNDQGVARSAILRTSEYDTGPGGDHWPAVDLASISLSPPAAGIAAALNLGGRVREVLSPAGVLGSEPSLVEPPARRPVPLASVQRRASASETGTAPAGVRQATAYAIDPALKLGLRIDPACANLKVGQHRRIYFGNPHPGQDGFGLATAVVDADENEVSTTPMEPFDPTKTTICLTASPRQGQPTSETWELVNLTDEDHNFHVHQTRFWRISSTQMNSGQTDSAAVLQDNLPLPHAVDATKCDGSVERFKSHECQPESVIVRIPFTQIGDFVFHCHILEHEDGGMMARIRVVAPPIRNRRE